MTESDTTCSETNPNPWSSHYVCIYKIEMRISEFEQADDIPYKIINDLIFLSFKLDLMTLHKVSLDSKLIEESGVLKSEDSDGRRNSNDDFLRRFVTFLF